MILASISAVKVDGEALQFDLQVLFQRLALAGYAFDYELCLFPPALAESVDFLNKPQKASFAEAICGLIFCQQFATDS